MVLPKMRGNGKAAMTAPFIHPATPPRLVKAFKRAGSYHKLAEALSDEKFTMNVRYPYELIHKGIEPTDRTVLGREIRHRLYLKRYKPKPRRPKPPAPKHLIWWNNIGKRMRHMIIERLHRHKEYYRDHPETSPYSDQSS